ncbi:hypothetical protein ABW19_dt0207118 [Dactylella cylindrospora]|nr:hypothetical protein ABW19_dt0207118 [Dactylella cylindrospora]
MLKYGFILWLFIQAVSAAAISEHLPLQPREEYAKSKGLNYVKYTGPRYHLTKEDIKALESGNQSWTKPADMPVIYVDDGTFLDFGDDGDNNSTLAKRDGWHYMWPYTGRDCRGQPILEAYNFGCGTGCISMNRHAFSAQMLQERRGRPYPTMSVWQDIGCSGHHQSMGIIGLDSCTNSNNCCGFSSFIAYWNC